MRNRLNVLLDTGLIELVEGGFGKRCLYKVVHGAAKAGAAVGLPTAKELKATMKEKK